MESDDSSRSEKLQTLLSRKINELPLKIKSTHLEELISQLYRELDAAGIDFKPPTYLSDIWGCPNEVPTIGIPFYLADSFLRKIHARLTRAEDEDDLTILKILRHEAGHAFNYAYRLFDYPEWQSLFGCFSLPYRDDYTPDPFSMRFVSHIPGCYAQKHPDDDFAETFAVWLTPFSNWQMIYAHTPALNKLLYVNRMVSIFGHKVPVITGGRLDVPFEEMHITLGEWYQTAS